MKHRTPIIPKRFKIGGIEVDTVIEDGLIENGHVGHSRYGYQQIDIAKKGLPTSTIEQAYIHEVVHWILFIMNDEKRDDETFVDIFSHFLYQMIKSAEIDREEMKELEKQLKEKK